MAVVADGFDYGFGSPHWMLKAMLLYVPREQLNLGVAEMIDFMVYTDREWGIQEAFDVLAQYALTGQYTKTGEISKKVVSGEDIDSRVAEFGKILGDLPEAKDPMVDFKLNEEEEDKK